ncbi:MAG: deoxyribodipyrimidine photo-lyase [Chloroflexota bacterium]|nr:deoxyribodipyrimidine photo-lyase [Chloroflexota bacterium]
MKTAIWWIRRDLRLHDNRALQKALDTAESVIPVFILDPHLLQMDALRRQNFLFRNLQHLADQLSARNCPLVVRRGKPLVELARLKDESGASAIIAEADYSPYASSRDAELQAELGLELVQGLLVYPPGTSAKDDGTPYTVFTPFYNKWLGLPLPGGPLPAPQHLPSHADLFSVPIPQASETNGFPAGEEAAQRRLQEFLQTSVGEYAVQRDRVDLDGTSLLSPYLRFGLLSPRYVYTQLRPFLENPIARDGAAKWLNELVWREFYVNILVAFPHVLRGAFRPAMRDIPWRDSPADLQAWQSGRTGYPLVDAGMRQLAESGWMHNRARMVTASFLTKDLLINWQAGETWFMQQLLDGDPASNNGGWQWTAGTGTDAAPYFRVFNPVTQSKKFDPQGSYIRTWLPELAAVPDAYIHEPWKMPAGMQADLGMRIGRDYPAPIVDHKFARQRTLDAYKK